MALHTARLDYGRRLLPQIVDGLAVTDPDQPFYHIPLTANIMDGFYTVTANKFAAAVNRAAWWLDGCMGGKSGKFDTIAYTGAGTLFIAMTQIFCRK